eukprot:SAG11_NODE_15962_length_561_cov_0.898268_1_plen_150_part_10
MCTQDPASMAISELVQEMRALQIDEKLIDCALAESAGARRAIILRLIAMHRSGWGVVTGALWLLRHSHTRLHCPGSYVYGWNLLCRYDAELAGAYRRLTVAMATQQRLCSDTALGSELGPDVVWMIAMYLGARDPGQRRLKYMPTWGATA